MEQESISQLAPPVEPPRGMYPGRLDANGRLKLPAVFQQYFAALPEKKLFVTSLDEHIAQIYPIGAWRENEKFFDAYVENPEVAQDVWFTANNLGADAEPDSQGRLTFPAKLRKALSMDNTELHLYSYKGRVQVMTEAVYEERRQRSSRGASQNVTLLERAGLK